MKKMILPLAVLGVFLFSIGCNKNNDVPAEQQIVGTWTMQSAVGHYTVLGVSRQDTTWFTSKDVFNFKADGSLAIDESDTHYTGKWKITAGKLIITETNYMDFTGGFDIPKLTGADLQLHYAQTDANGSLDQTLSLKK